MEITHVDNPREKFCFEAEDGDRSLFTWRIWYKRRHFFKWEKFEHIGDLMGIVCLREEVEYIRESRNN